jgi:hypothetical protein
LSTDYVQHGHPHDRPEREGDIPLARVAIVKVRGEGSEIQHVAADSSPAPRGRVVGGKNADASMQTLLQARGPVLAAALLPPLAA